MLHTKFVGNRCTGHGEEDCLRDFYHIRVWWPSWSCDPDARTNFRSPYPWRLHTKFGFDWPSGFVEEDV